MQQLRVCSTQILLLAITVLEIREIGQVLGIGSDFTRGSVDSIPAIVFKNSNPFSIIGKVNLRKRKANWDNSGEGCAVVIYTSSIYESAAASAAYTCATHPRARYAAFRSFCADTIHLFYF